MKKMDLMSHFIMNLAASKLDSEHFSNPHLICPKSWTIQFYPLLHDLRMINIKWWPIRVHKQKVLVLHTIAAAYILKATTAMKVFYPKLTDLIASLLNCNVS